MEGGIKAKHNCHQLAENQRRVGCHIDGTDMLTVSVGVTENEINGQRG